MIRPHSISTSEHSAAAGASGALQLHRNLTASDEALKAKPVTDIDFSSNGGWSDNLAATALFAGIAIVVVVGVVAIIYYVPRRK